MSTTFWIKKEDEYIKVAFRTSSIRGSRWLNPLATLLPDDTKLKALDNSQQWINTIWDFKKHLLDD